MSFDLVALKTLILLTYKIILYNMLIIHRHKALLRTITPL